MEHQGIKGEPPKSTGRQASSKWKHAQSCFGVPYSPTKIDKQLLQRLLNTCAVYDNPRSASDPPPCPQNECYDR